MSKRISPQQAVVQPRGTRRSQKRGVQPAALIARLKREQEKMRKLWPIGMVQRYCWLNALSRAIQIIQSEARDAEHNAAG